ncbi:MAG: CDP-diacylglycerol--glycerol-3-phosphate 3-phosphatidyltransferase [Candidatus Latescibacterota bacterium]|jgi:CDP-diacylglycerol--glycerol-3-phosphate 3-phosphatidyltransferase
MLANLLSLSRVFLTIPLAYCLRQGDEAILSTIALLLLAAATDLADGFAARRLGQVSRLGKMIDPLSDKIFLTILLGSLVIWHDFPIWLLGLLLFRDTAIVAIGIFLLRSRGLVIAANRWGKYTTACMGFTTLSYILPAPDPLRLAMTTLATVLVLISSLSYAHIFRQVISGVDAADVY